MRLIDADKLKIKHFVQRGDQPIGYEGTQPVYEYTDLIAYDVDNAPTVKAIPVEWIDGYIKRRANDVNIYAEILFISDMVEEWNKENDRN